MGRQSRGHERPQEGGRDPLCVRAFLAGPWFPSLWIACVHVERPDVVDGNVVDRAPTRAAMDSDASQGVGPVAGMQYVMHSFICLDDVCAQRGGGAEGGPIRRDVPHPFQVFCFCRQHAGDFFVR